MLESALRVLHMQSHLTLEHYIQSLPLNNYHTLLPKVTHAHTFVYPITHTRIHLYMDAVMCMD